MKTLRQLEPEIRYEMKLMPPYFSLIMIDIFIHFRTLNQVI